MAQENETPGQEQTSAPVVGDQAAVDVAEPAASPATTQPQGIVLSITGIDILKKPIDEELLQTLAQLRHTHGLLTDESINSYLVWLINCDEAAILKDVAARRR